MNGFNRHQDHGFLGKVEAQAVCTTSNLWSVPLARLTRSMFLTGGLVAATALSLTRADAQTKPSPESMPDAQVEAGVLKALAGAPELATQAITTRTVYGTVTLSGSVTSEALRSRAENLAANAPGVKKVVDELALNAPGGQATTNATDSSSGGTPAPGMVLQSDGTYAPAPSNQSNADPAFAPNPAAGVTQPVRNNPEADQQADRQMEPQQSSSSGPPPQQSGRYPAGGYPQNNYPQPGYPQAGPQQSQNYPPQNGYPQNGYPQYGNPASSYPQNGYPQNGYPQNGYPQNGYPQNGYPGPQSYPQTYPPRPARGVPVYAAPSDGGQAAGQTVIVPTNTLIRLRINQRISSDRSKPGETFDGIIVNDVVADGAIAIPRGAAVHGTIVDAKASGVLTGRGELTLQLNQVTLAGRSYPIVSDNWSHNGGDKTIETINKTAGLGAIGALFGAAAGGGVGAAVGGGIGAAAGLGSSATSGRGQVVLPSEAVLTFHLAQPASVSTVSEQEMQRLAFGVPAGGSPPQIVRRYPRPYYYPAPVPYGYPY